MEDRDYTCPRCNYSCKYKGDMRKHFRRKTSCPDKNDLELTSEIEEIVLRNRFYHAPKRSSSDISKKIVNNYNFLTNFIGKMPYEDKLCRVLNYQDQKLIDFEDGLDTHFTKRNLRLENDDYRQPYELGEKDLFHLVDDVTKIDTTQLNRLNILFDKKVNRVLFYSCQKWDSAMIEYGITDLVRYLKSYYLDNYERYLIRHIHGSKYTGQQRCSLKRHLEIYYRFLITTDLGPMIFGCTDEELLGHTLKENNPFYLEEYYMALFNDIKSQVKAGEKNATRKKIINILKENTVHNLEELNKRILSIIQVDKSFQDQLLQIENKIE